VRASFADRLVERGVILLGGPIASDDAEDIVLLAVEAKDEDAVRSVFHADPWTVHRAFRIKDVQAWTLWLDGRFRQSRLPPGPSSGPGGGARDRGRSPSGTAERSGLGDQ
jgi:uncharacterized protein YciI